MDDTRQRHPRRTFAALIASLLLAASISATDAVLTAAAAAADEAVDSAPETPQELPVAPTPDDGSDDGTDGDVTVSPPDQPADAPAPEPAPSDGASPAERFHTAADDPPVGASAAYVASRTRLSWQSTDYPILAFVPAAGQPTIVEADGTAVGGVSGTQDFHAILADVPGVGKVTYVLDTQHLAAYSQDCDGVDAFFDAILDFSATCDNFEAAYLTNNGAGSNYTWNGLDNFENPGVTVMAGDTPTVSLDYDENAEPPGDGGGGDGGGDGDGFPGSDYVASSSPLAIDGTDYSDPVPGMPAVPLALWLISGDSPPTVAAGGATPVAGLFDDVGLPIHVFLSDMDGARTTVFLDGGFGVSDCDGFETLINAISGGGVTPDCHASKAGFFTPNGSEADFTWSGFGSFDDGVGSPLGATVEVADGFTSPPTLEYQVTPPDGGGGDGGGGDDPPDFDHFVASNTPLRFDGVGYGDPAFGCAEPGVFFLAADEDHDPVCVTSDDTPIPAIGYNGDPRDIDVALVDAGGGSMATVYVDSGILLGNALTRDCTGIEGLFDGFGPTVTCDNYKQSILTAPVGSKAVGATQADYGFSGLGGFDTGGPVTVVGGFTDPPFLHFVDVYECCLDASTGEGAEVDYSASRSPLEWMGDVYDDAWPPPPFETNWNFYLTSAIGDLSGVPQGTFATNDGIRPVGIPPPAGLQGFHAVLFTVDGTIQTGPSDFEERTVFMTYYVDNGVFESLGGPPYGVGCDGFEQMAADFSLFVTDVEPTPVIVCVAFHRDVLAPNQPGEDFTFNGLDTWNDGDGNPIAGDLPTVNGSNSDPYIHYDPQSRWYAASVSPWSYNGTDFTEAAYWDTDTGSPGVTFGTAAQSGNEFIYENDQWPRGIPGGAGINDFIVVLVEVDGRFGTLYYDTALQSAFAGSFDGLDSCPDFDDLLESLLDNPVRNIPHACHAFGSVVLDSPIDGFGDPLCQDFTFTDPAWTDQNGDPLDAGSAPQITSGFDDPSLTYVGPKCQVSADPPEEPNPDPDASDDPDDPPGPIDQDDPGSGDSSGSSPEGGSTNANAPGDSATLPRTGVEFWPLVLTGLALVAAGLALDRIRRVGPWKRRASV